MNRSTAPPGYESNYAAIMDLLRFGPAIWSHAQMMALIFHAERSTMYGKEADTHTETQAIEGIYSERHAAWIRGPSGLKRSTWYQANRELEIDDEKPDSNPNAVLRKRREGAGRGQKVEYEIDWKAVKGRIYMWQQEGSTIRTLLPTEGSSIWTHKGPASGPFSENSGVENKGAGEGKGSSIRTRQSDFLQSGLNSRSDAPSRSQINLELELAAHERPRTDTPSTLILQANERLDLPLAVISRFLHDKAQDFRARNYPFTVKLLAESLGKEIFRWMRANARFVEEETRRRDTKRQQGGSLATMPGDQQPLIQDSTPTNAAEVEFPVDEIMKPVRAAASGRKLR